MENEPLIVDIRIYNVTKEMVGGQLLVEWHLRETKVYNTSRAKSNALRWLNRNYLPQDFTVFSRPQVDDKIVDSGPHRCAYWCSIVLFGKLERSIYVIICSNKEGTATEIGKKMGLPIGPQEGKHE